MDTPGPGPRAGAHWQSAETSIRFAVLVFTSMQSLTELEILILPQRTLPGCDRLWCSHNRRDDLPQSPYLAPQTLLALTG